jgi:hypothetical protein
VTGGACYTTCTPFGLACSGARECRQIRFDASLGICVGRGAGSAGQPCDPLDVVATGCVAGQDCVTEGTSATCHRKCNFFATNPGCPAGSACTIGGVCSSAAVDGAIVGAACTATAMQGDDCGQESGAARGICVTDSRGLGCYRYCRVAGADCGGGAWECRGVFPTVPQIGVCVDHGVCGDGGADQYASCDACVDAESADCCSVEFAACDLGSPCEILSSCLSACAADDQPCIQACVMATPDGVTPYLDYSRCVVGDAAQGFVGACGGICAQ